MKLIFLSLLATRLNSFRAESPLDKWETRASRWGSLDLFQTQTMSPTSIITDDLKAKAVRAAGSALEVPVINYDAGVSVTNQTIPLVTTGSPSTSALITITFTHYYWGFLIHPAQHFNNEISMQREFAEQYKKHALKYMSLQDAACTVALEADKTQVLNDTLGGRYSLVGDTMIAPQAEKQSFVGDVSVVMEANDYFDTIHMVANPSLQSHVRNNLIEKGDFNSENKTYQYADKIWHFTNNLPDAATHKATGFAVADDSVGILQQFAPDCVQRNETHKHKWDIEMMPIINMPFGTFFYDDAVDGSALSGAATAQLTATKAEAYAFHTAIALVTVHNSLPATRPSSIIKVALSES